MESNLDFLDSRWRYNAELAPVWVGIGPWVARRDAIRAIGGFDPAVLVSEDDDINSRIIHYLARHGGQNSNVCLTDLYGYHLYHPTSELFDWHREAHDLIDARRNRLRADPTSTEDVIQNNHLDDPNSLIEAVRRTPKPPAMKRYREDTIRKVGRRIVAAGKVLIGRR